MKEKKNFKIELVPYVLKALRETSGYSVEEVAKKLKTSEEKVNAAEEGKSSFTLTQIKKLADMYDRPLVAFFSDSAPKLHDLIDYRINREKKITPQVYSAERRAKYLSEQIKDLSNKRSQIPTFPEKLSPEELAKEFKKYLRSESTKFEKPQKKLPYYKNILEDILTIVIIEYPLKADDVRAFSTSSDISAIVLNEVDKPSIKLFSLFHEVCHLLKRNAGICSLDIEEDDQGIETYCNQFAAEFLIPSDDLKNEIKKFMRIDEEEINKLTETYGVSKQTMMIRLLRLRYIEKETYQAFKNKIDEKKIEVISEQKKFGRRNWDKIYLNRIGNLSLQEVKKAYNKENITFYEASDILDLKTKCAERFIT